MKILFILSVIINFLVCIYLGYFINYYYDRKIDITNKKELVKILLLIPLIFIFIFSNSIFLANIDYSLLIFYFCFIIALTCTSFFIYSDKFYNIPLLALAILCSIIFLAILLFIDITINEPSIATQKVSLYQIEKGSKKQAVTIELNKFDNRAKTYTVMQYDDEISLPLIISYNEISSYEIISEGNDKIYKFTKESKYYCLLSYFKFIKPIKEKTTTYSVYIKENNLRYKK